eukprot:TRINITY_DN1047_c0_g2_i1.p1 TRINITY_DN1047_c0_g2~~TRINITY_DN1047_c0_g2_i1.p1  ORF type:complete len:1360 (+),score=307.61 TRINITY_DN1047_c0_g2_i1:12-4091(+)
MSTSTTEESSELNGSSTPQSLTNSSTSSSSSVTLSISTEEEGWDEGEEGSLSETMTISTIEVLNSKVVDTDKHASDREGNVDESEVSSVDEYYDSSEESVDSPSADGSSEEWIEATPYYEGENNTETSSEEETNSSTSSESSNSEEIETESIGESYEEESSIEGAKDNQESIESSAIVIQNHIRSYYAISIYQRRAKLDSKRKNIVEEIISTETNYIKTLKVIVNSFLDPLERNTKSDNPWLSRKKLNKIFSTEIRVLLQLNQDFFEQLKSEVENSTIPKIGQVFFQLSNRGAFQYYQAYILNYEEVRPALNEVKEKCPEFAEFIKKREKRKECRNADLESLLIWPVQRIPQYKLLLSDLLKNTWSEHPDYDNVFSALDLVIQAGKNANEKAREKANIEEVRKISSKLEGFRDLATPLRRIMGKYNFSELVEDNDVYAEEKRILYLFNDILIVAKEIEDDMVKHLQYAYYEFSPISCNILDDFHIKYCAQLNINDTSYLMKFRTKSSLKEASDIITECSEEFSHVFKKKEKITLTKKNTTRTRKKSARTNQTNKEVLLKNLKQAKITTNQTLDEFGFIKDFVKAEHLKVEYASQVEISPTKQPLKYFPHVLLITRRKIITFDLQGNSEPFVFMLLDLRKIVSEIYAEFVIQFVGNHRNIYGISSLADEIINMVRIRIYDIFPSKKRLGWNITPKDRLWNASRPNKPCGGFVNTYKSVCNYHNIRPRDDIILEIKLLSDTGKTDFSVNRFRKPLSVEDVTSLLESLTHNGYFDGLILEDLPLTKSLMGPVFEYMKNNFVNTKFIVRNEIPRDMFSRLCGAMSDNSRKNITHLDLSGTLIDDKCLVMLGNLVSQYPIKILNLDDSRAKDKTWGSFFKSLKTDLVYKNLEDLSLGRAQLGGVGSGVFKQWMRDGDETFLKRLNFSGAKLKSSSHIITNTLSSLCVVSLEEINFSHCSLSEKSHSHFVTFIRLSINLKKIDISNASISSIFFRDILMSISNSNLQDVEIIAKNNNFDSETIIEISRVLESLRNICTLNISDNEFGEGGLIILFDILRGGGHSLQRIHLDNNFKIRSGNGSDIGASLKRLARSSSSPLSYISMKGGLKSYQKLRENMIPFLVALGNNSKITELNISGHNIGYNGTVALSMAIERNTTLKTLIWDDNQPTLPGLERFYLALENQCTLKYCPLSVMDIHSIFSDNIDARTTKFVQNLQMRLVEVSRRSLQVEIQQRAETLLLEKEMDRYEKEQSELISEETDTETGSEVVDEAEKKPKRKKKDRKPRDSSEKPLPSPSRRNRKYKKTPRPMRSALTRSDASQLRVSGANESEEKRRLIQRKSMFIDQALFNDSLTTPREKKKRRKR